MLYYNREEHCSQTVNARYKVETELFSPNGNVYCLYKICMVYSVQPNHMRLCIPIFTLVTNFSFIINPGFSDNSSVTILHSAIPITTYLLCSAIPLIFFLPLSIFALAAVLHQLRVY